MELTSYQRFIHASRYARWLPDESRRETWKETVNRYTGFFNNRFPGVFPTEDVNKDIESIKKILSQYKGKYPEKGIY